VCPKQPCPNQYVQGIDTNLDSWFKEFRAPNHKQIAQIQKQQQQNAQPFLISNLSVSIASRSPSPLSCPPSPFLQPAAVISSHPVCTALFTAVSDFFWNLLFQSSTRAPITISGHQTLASSSSTAPIINISAQDLMNLIDSMVTSISALTASIQALVNAQASNVSISPSASRLHSIVKKPVIFKGKDLESAQLFRSTFCIWINANEDWFALHDSQGKKVQGANGAILPNVHKMVSLALSFMAKDGAVWA
jgi:hypothetical protein